MKNTKKLLILVLALIALTLAMSISIFAEESTDPATCEHTYDWNIVGCPKCGTLAVLDEGSTNVSSNLGYTIYFATNLNDLSNTNYDVIRLKNNISLPSGGKITNPNAIIDLGGNVLYRNGGYLGLRIVSAKGFVNGYVYKTNGGSQIMAVTSLEFMEDVTLCANSTKSNNATGLLMNTAGAYLGSMKNVTICAGVLNDLNSNNFDFVNVGTNGIYNHGIEATQGTIGSMENVKISTYGQAITTAAKIGTMTNCVFSGDNIALNITTLKSEMKFVDCEIHSKNLAIYIANADDSTEEAPVDFDLGNTKIITDGAVFDISEHISGNEMFNELTTAVASVNGQLYTSLADAVNALNASKEEVTTFALIGDLAVDETIVIDKKVNFSFGGASYDVPVYGTNQVTHKTVSGYAVTSSVDVVFSVVEGGNLTISGEGTLSGGENAIVADGGEILIAAGTYEGYNPREFVSTESCVVNTDGVYTIASEHDYDDDVGADKTTYQVDGVCNNCGYVRGIVAVDNVYYATIEEAKAAALTSGKAVVLAADIVIDGEETWDLTGVAFNFNGCTVTGDLNIVGGTFSADVTDYLDDAYCCKYNSQTKQYEVISHIWADATCAAPKTCTNCGATEGETLPHAWTEATCTEPKTCSACGATEGEALGHNYVAGEEVDGTTVYTCTNCGDSYTCVHNFVVLEEVKVSCLVDGYVKSECSLCGKIKEETTPKLPHEYHWNFLAADGVTYIHGCPNCGTEAKKDVVDGVEQNYSTNLGYKILYVTDWNGVANNVGENVSHKVLRFANDITVPSGNNYAKVYGKDLIIDLAGYTISSPCGFGSFYLYQANSLVNGTIKKTDGGRQALLVYNVQLIEDIDIVVSSPEAKNVTAVLVSSNGTYGSYIGAIRNVTIDSARDANGEHINGVGIYNHGIEIPNSNTVIGSMENVEIYSKGQAILTQATIGTMTDCVFSGEKIALVIQRLQGEFKLVNCVVDGGTLAIELSGVIASEEKPASFVFDSTTTFETSGIIFNASAIENAENCDISSIAGTVALVNGKLYTSIEDAVAALEASEEEVTTFALMQDLEITKAIVINKKVNFSLGGGTFEIPKYGYSYGTKVTVPGYTISAPNDVNGDGIFHVVEGGVLTLSGDGTVNSVGNNIYNIAVWADGGEVIINGGTYTNVGEGLTEDHYDLIYVKNGGSVVINGGTFIAQTPKWTLNLHDTTEGSIVVNAGTFYGYNPAESETEPNGIANFVAEGKCLILVEEGDLAGYYVVGEHVWVDATCTEAKTCSVCGTTEGEALGHDYVASEPAENGDITYTCSRCGDSYVVNNVVVNGAYFMGTDAVVFENGVLTAMGGEFSYTYNVTTGMITTNNAGIYFQVIDGKIYFRGAQMLHQHVEESYVAEEQEDGSINYICQFCGQVIYTINNSAINGTYYMDGSEIVFADGVLTAMGGEFSYTYNVTTGMITTNNAGIHFQVIDGKIYFRGATPLHTHDAENLITEVTAPTCDKEGYTTYICPFCGPLYEDDVVEATGHSYVESGRTETEITYTCSVCGDSYSEEYVPEHTHTEEVIPMVLPTPSVDGYTAGIKCSECDEIIVAPELITVTDMLDTKDENFRIAAASLSAQENISVNYKVVATEGYNNVYMVFVFNGKEYVVTEYTIEASSGRLAFKFNETFPQLMQDNIVAYVYAETAVGEYSRNCILEYSVMQYIVNQLKKNDAALTTVMSDILYMGAMTQLKQNYKTDSLVTDLVTEMGYTLTPTAFTSIPSDVNVQAVTGDRTTGIDWKSGSLAMGASTEVILKFAADDIEGLVAKIEIAGETYEYNVAELPMEDGRYVIYFDKVRSYEYDEVITATFEKNGEQVGSTLTYSINTFLYRNYESSKYGDADKNLMKALYTYGVSIAKYFA